MKWKTIKNKQKSWRKARRESKSGGDVCCRIVSRFAGTFRGLVFELLAIFSRLTTASYRLRQAGRKVSAIIGNKPRGIV